MTAIEKAAQAAIKVLIPWLGYTEKASNSQLDSLSGNTGSNNYTFIARYFDELWNSGFKFYNTRKQGAEWCDMTVDYAMCKAFSPQKALKVLYQPMESAGAGCKYSANFYRANGAWISRSGTPKPGDQIFFGPYGSETHTGIVERVDGAKVHTIEGNTSNALMRRSYDRSYSNISGYGRPNYQAVADMFDADEDAPIADDIDTPGGLQVCQVTLPVLRQGSTGGYVKTLQILLRAYGGYEIGADGVFGAYTDEILRKYQKSRGLTVDGKAGAQTWGTLVK